MQFCVLKGYLRRVRDYRISLEGSVHLNTNNIQPNGESEGSEAAKVKPKKTLRDFCDGTNDSDSLACLGFRKYMICAYE